MGKYDGKGKKKVKGGHRCRYRDDNKIEALHGIYKEPKDNDDSGWDDDNNDGDWDDMKDKEQEEDNDDDNDVVNITAVQFFGMPDDAFLGKEAEYKKKKKKEDKSKGDDDDSRKNSGVSAKRGKKTR